MCNKTFLDDLTDGHTRVERGVRILENYLQVLAQMAHLGIFETRKVDTVVEHRLIAHKLGIVRVRLFAVSYTHLDVYKRQALTVKRERLPFGGDKAGVREDHSLGRLFVVNAHIKAEMCIRDSFQIAASSGSTYSYTDVITVPKAGTTVYFFDQSFTDYKSGKYASTSALIVSHWKKVGSVSYTHLSVGFCYYRFLLYY